MQNRRVSLAVIGGIVVQLCATAAPAMEISAGAGSSPGVRSLLPSSPEGFARTPLAFIKNAGQARGASLYVVRGPSGAALFGPCGVEYLLRQSARSSAVTLEFVAPSPSLRVEGVDRLEARVSFLTGSEETRWRRDVPAFSGVAYRDVWPGVDVVFRGSGSHLKYDIVASPGADVHRIALRFAGAGRPRIAPDGRLIVRSGSTEFAEYLPSVYQEKDGRRVEIGGAFTVDGDVVGFDLEGYDPWLPLVIDPASDLNWSVLIAGSDYDSGQAVAIDQNRNCYVTGETNSADLPGPAGSYDRSYNQLSDVYVAKFSPNGTLVYLTYLGGSEDDFSKAIAVDSTGSVYVGGYTDSHDYPVTAGVFGPAHHNAGNLDGFVTRLSPGGDALEYSTFLGGVNNDWVFGIAVDQNRRAYVCGQTSSADFPVTANVYDDTFNGSYDAFAARISHDGASLQYATYIGGSDTDWATCIALDSSREVCIGGLTQSENYPVLNAYLPARRLGFDGFVTRLDSNGRNLVFSTYLGGYGQDIVNAITLDSSSNVYVTGTAGFSGFPTTAGVFDPDYDGGNSDAFVTSFTSAGSIRYSTFVGGLGDDRGQGIAVDASQSPYVVGQTTSANFPRTAGAYSTTLRGTDDAFFTKLAPGGSALAYSTYLGGDQSDIAKGIALDSHPSAYVIGITSSPDFPSTSVLADTSLAAFDVNAFLARLLGPVTGDNTPPSRPVVTDDGAYTTSITSLHASWSSADPESGVALYEYAIGTSPADPGSGYLVGWKQAGVATQATESGLTLQPGTRYYWYVRATNGQSLVSPVGASNGILVVSKVVSTPAEAKMEADGVALVAAGAVTANPAALGQRLYVESEDRSSGIACGTTDACSEGDRVQVAGVMATVQGERIISGAAVQVTGPGTPIAPLRTNLRGTSGGAFHFNPVTGAGQRAVTLPSYGGITTVGLLVAVSGLVTSTDAEYIYVNDGSWDGVSLKVSRLNLPAGVQAGSYITAVGLASMQQDGSNYRTVLLVRRPADVEIVIP